MLKKKITLFIISITLIFSLNACMLFNDTDLDDSARTSSGTSEERASSDSSSETSVDISTTTSSEESTTSSSSETSDNSTSETTTDQTSTTTTSEQSEPTTSETTTIVTSTSTTSENINEDNDYNSREYEVVSGDTWWGIAQKYGIRHEFLITYNDKTIDDGLNVGETIKIPSEEEIKEKNLSIRRYSDDEISVSNRVKGELASSHEGYEYSYSAIEVINAMYTKEPLLDGKKMAFLTYDDGISIGSTCDLLDDLEELSIPATFFIVGNSINQGNSYLLQRMVDEGHSIANHSYNHDYNLLYPSKQVNPAEIERQFLRTDRLFRHVLGDDFISNLWRHPGGSTWGGIENGEEILRSYGVVSLGWNTLNDDAVGPSKNQTVEEQVDAILKHWHNYGSPSTIVVLMHDTPNSKVTREALPEIVNALRNEGFEFGTVY